MLNVHLLSMLASRKQNKKQALVEPIEQPQINNNDVEAEADAEAEIELDELTTTAKAPAGDNNDVYIDAFPDLSSINDIKTYGNLTSLTHSDKGRK